MVTGVVVDSQGVIVAWRQLLEEGLIEELEYCEEKSRAWALGRYIKDGRKVPLPADLETRWHPERRQVWMMSLQFSVSMFFSLDILPSFLFFPIASFFFPLPLPSPSPLF